MPPVRASSRFKTKPFSSFSNALRFLPTGPFNAIGCQYTPSKERKRGGVSSYVKLGPFGDLQAGTDSDSSKPPGIAKVRESYPNETFVAGHLLNADFGGDGTDSSNLVVLTSKANSDHKNMFESKVKEAVRQLKNIYEKIHDLHVDFDQSVFDLGISVLVMAEDDNANLRGLSQPDCFLFKEISCSAMLEPQFDFEELMRRSSLKSSTGEEIDYRAETDLIRIKEWKKIRELHASLADYVASLNAVIINNEF